QDPLALGLSGLESKAALLAALAALQAELARQSTPEIAQQLYGYGRAVVALRQRYTEAALDKALERGIEQYVILGAGLASFAYRRQDLAGVLRVFEVDHPATQQWKRARLRELDIPLPHNLTFVPVDFEQQTLADGLRAGGHQSERPTFVSWLGVTVFLTEAAVFETLRYVASLPLGSDIVFEYALREAQLDTEERHRLAVVKALAAARGEPWLSAFEPTELAARVKELGFRQVWDLGPEEANARYFSGRTDGLCIPHMSHIMQAQV